MLNGIHICTCPHSHSHLHPASKQTKLPNERDHVFIHFIVSLISLCSVCILLLLLFSVSLSLLLLTCFSIWQIAHLTSVQEIRSTKDIWCVCQLVFHYQKFSSLEFLRLSVYRLCQRVILSVYNTHTHNYNHCKLISWDVNDNNEHRSAVI